MIKSLEVKNFKAIESSRVALTPLTAFIGYNGSGKSSLLEALETYRIIIKDGLDAGIAPFRGFEHIYYKGAKEEKEYEKDAVKFMYSPIEFSFEAIIDRENVNFTTAVAQEVNGKKNIYFIQEKYHLISNDMDLSPYTEIIRHLNSSLHYLNRHNNTIVRNISPDKSLLSELPEIEAYIESWQFLSMNTFLMGNPLPQKKTGGKIYLNKDGSNIAEYLLSIRDVDESIFEGIIETLQYVLPYAKDIQPSITSELERMVYMQLTEQDFKVPGWLLSTGTLKLLALLAVFRHPEASPLIVIEEIENGLDPRSINLIVGEIREYIKGAGRQVIITTHSPYLLDLLHLSQIVFVERREGKVVFNRPYDFEELRAWSKEYSPGELYIKDKMQQVIK